MFYVIIDPYAQANRKQWDILQPPKFIQNDILSDLYRSKGIHTYSLSCNRTVSRLAPVACPAFRSFFIPLCSQCRSKLVNYLQFRLFFGYIPFHSLQSLSLYLCVYTYDGYYILPLKLSPNLLFIFLFCTCIFRSCPLLQPRWTFQLSLIKFTLKIQLTPLASVTLFTKN